MTAGDLFKAFGVAVIVIAILVGLWFGGWALYKANVEKKYEVNTGTQQYQAGLISQQRDRVAAYDATDNEAQKRNIATAFCAVHSELTKVPDDLQVAYGRIC